ncbi:hypothetical protein PV10_01205 [Exophiala mesophila]|uniref:NADAR domain-containing protein n=1 Tax=Exophiala mesophila TaxID=212818 RepID=A0A0D1ZU56_EXOME|nr:uncharacterized protein PV10_01205 [Exophiala mesophila]KIV97454.1 hypothetical protein PV10_01205 [Exophiala mesophila]
MAPVTATNVISPNRYNTRSTNVPSSRPKDQNDGPNSRSGPEGRRSRKRNHDKVQQETTPASKPNRNPKKPSTSGRKGTLMTEKHILFWGGPLSNWNLGALFPGDRVLSLLLPRLDDAQIPHPKETSLGTSLIRNHEFNCGEQAMMALKAWLFEDNETLKADATSHGDKLKFMMSTISNPAEYESLDALQTPPVIDKTRQSFLVNILHASSPKAQKALGRQVPNFNGSVWQKAAAEIVTCTSIARAEADEELRSWYVKAGSRRFVEASPVDRIWGIGLKWDNPLADDESKWRGKNLLGVCHDAAAEVIRKQYQ